MNVEAIIEARAHRFLEELLLELDEDNKALSVIRQYIATGCIDASQECLLKIQLADTLKIIGITIPHMIIPGASILIPILLKAASKYHINLLPAALPNNKEAM